MTAYEDKTLDELEGESTDNFEYDSYVVKNCQRLRRVPLQQFTIEDLRLMVGQGFSLEYLVPIALKHLETFPFVEGDFYTGDLLDSVLGISGKFWLEHPALQQKMNLIVAKAINEFNSIEIDDELSGEMKAKLNDFEICKA